ncbi:hypothetical protein EMCRGX_G000697 [Ephydatia muelleri]
MPEVDNLIYQMGNVLSSPPEGSGNTPENQSFTQAKCLSLYASISAVHPPSHTDDTEYIRNNATYFTKRHRAMMCAFDTPARE